MRLATVRGAAAAASIGGAWRLKAACLLVTLPTAAAGVEITDSGWAFAPLTDQASPLASRRIALDELLPGDAIDRIAAPQASMPPGKADRPGARAGVRPDAAPPRATPRTAMRGDPGGAAARPEKMKWRRRRTRDAASPPASVAEHPSPGSLAQPRELADHDDLADAFRAAGPAGVRWGSAAQQSTPTPGESPPQRRVRQQPVPQEPAPFPRSDESAEGEPSGRENNVNVGEPKISVAERAAVDGAPDSARTSDEPAEASPPTSEVTPAPQAGAARDPAPREGEDAELAPDSAPREAPADGDGTDVPGEGRRRDAAAQQPGPQPPRLGIAGALRPPAPADRPLTRTQQYLRRRLRSVLSYYYRRPLNSTDHQPWEIMHGMLAYGLHSRVIDRTAGSRPVTAVGYLCFNKPAKGQRLLRLSAEGRLDPEVAYGVQGHHGQFLAMLAQCNVNPDYPVRVQDRKLTIHDLIAYEKRTCHAESELSFKLIALAHYLDLDETWLAQDGGRWSVPRLIEEERNQKIRGAACGGTHRLAGLSLAYRIRQARGEPLDGEFLAAKRFTDEYLQYALRLQNRDGSLSTEWFRGPGAEDDINRRVRTTGHLLEWLMYTLPNEQMRDSRIVRAVNYLTGLLASNTDNAWEIGPLSHALHALLLYDQRVFQPHDDPGAVAYRIDGPNREPTRLAYESIGGRVYGTLPSSDEAEKLREKAASPGGLRGLFGIGRSSVRRSR